MFSKRSIQHASNCFKGIHLGSSHPLRNLSIGYPGETPFKVDSKKLPNVVLHSDGLLRRVILNREEQINTLNLNSAKALRNAVLMYSRNDAIAAVSIEGRGDVFCGGLDLQQIFKYPSKAKELRKRLSDIAKILNSCGNKPMIGFMNGTVLGGGYALAQGSARVATENTVFHIPEMFYGQALDGGLSYSLSKAKGGLAMGLFIGLSGRALSGMDMMDAGLATHFMESRTYLNFLSQVWNTAHQTNGYIPIWRLLDDHEEDNREMLGHSELLEVFNSVASSFEEVQSVEEIMSRLKALNSENANEVLRNMNRACPTSLKVIFLQITQACTQDLTFAECLKQECNANLKLQEKPEFEVGINGMAKGGAVVWPSACSDDEVKEMVNSDTKP